ncbi:MAG: periplasmic heavy metal sensor [Gammaproteobacteria bacterium]|nr:periplasmic heavy metal sensor [Gammaproteobacteria bacterium]MDP2142127.1 periplasmic heavy metal sensor [Gammaproteobacteria bacterium]MDP2348265.1 periplasmic heavy metal sensor [Gammaproteobacteria bacterium]
MTINRRRLMTWLLVVSLGFNLLVVGGITARVMSRSEGRPIPPNLSWILDNLEEETRATLRPRLREFGEVVRPLRGAVFRAQRQVNDLILEEPMNKEAIALAFDELRKASLEYQETTHTQTIAIFELLTEEQRKLALSFMDERRDPLDSRRDRDSLERDTNSRDR